MKHKINLLTLLQYKIDWKFRPDPTHPRKLKGESTLYVILLSYMNEELLHLWISSLLGRLCIHFLYVWLAFFLFTHYHALNFVSIYSLHARQQKSAQFALNQFRGTISVLIVKMLTEAITLNSGLEPRKFKGRIWCRDHFLVTYGDELQYLQDLFIPKHTNQFHKACNAFLALA